MADGGHLFLIDGSNYIFRAYYALPALKRRSDNLPLGAVAGFCNMLWKLLCDFTKDDCEHSPSHIAVIFDYSSKTFRKELYPQYKANRREVPSDLLPQFPLIRAATKAFELAVIEQEGYEADDLIASYARAAAAANMRVTIVGADKDLMQLVSPQITLYDSLRDCWIDSQFVEQKYGVGPQQMIELQSLMGDSTDNIPGVAGIGPKRAAQLLHEFGSLENLLSNLDKIKNAKWRSALEEGRANIALSRQLVTLRADLALPLAIDDLKRQMPDIKALLAFLKALEFRKLSSKIAADFDVNLALIEPDSQYKAQTPLPKNGLFASQSTSQSDDQAAENNALALSTLNGQAKPQSINGKINKLIESYSKAYAEETAQPAPADAAKGPASENGPIAIKAQEIKGAQALQNMIGEIEDIGAFAFSLDLTLGQDALCGIAFAYGDRLCYFAIDKMAGDWPLCQSLLTGLFNHIYIRKIAYDIKDKAHKLAQLLIAIDAEGFFSFFDDILLISYILHNGQFALDLGKIAKHYFAYEPFAPRFRSKAERQEAASWLKRAAIEQALLLWRLDQPQRLLLIKEQRLSLYYSFDKPLLSILYEMERCGIKIDKLKLAELSQEFRALMTKHERRIFALAGEEFNIASPKILGHILYDKLQLTPLRKTKSQQFSTDSEALENLAQAGYEIAGEILEWRQMAKMISTYSEALPKFADGQDRVHSNFNAAGTLTGRLSSSSPNLQNIPIRTEQGRKIRSSLIAKEGFYLVALDYSQIELRLLAHMAQITPLKEAFRKGSDIHSLTAAQIFSCPLNEVTSQLRRYAKMINYGIIYGMSAFGLAKQLQIPRAEAQLYIDNYLAKLSGIKTYMLDVEEKLKRDNYVETLFGRRIYYPAISEAKAPMRALVLRAAINAPLQGSAADIMRRAMVKIERYLKENQLKDQVNMLLQVHDELVFEIKQDCAENMAFNLQKLMQEAPLPLLALDPPLEVSVKISKSW